MTVRASSLPSRQQDIGCHLVRRVLLAAQDRHLLQVEDGMREFVEHDLQERAKHVIGRGQPFRRTGSGDVCCQFLDVGEVLVADGERGVGRLIGGVDVAVATLDLDHHGPGYLPSRETVADALEDALGLELFVDGLVRLILRLHIGDLDGRAGGSGMAAQGRHRKSRNECQKEQEASTHRTLPGERRDAQLTRVNRRISNDELQRWGKDDPPQQAPRQVGRDAIRMPLLAATFDPERSDVFSKIRKDFDAAGVAQSDEQILRVMHELMIQAGNQLRGTRADTLDATAGELARHLTSR